MKLQVNFKIVNSNFDQKRADQYNWGEPSPENPKYFEEVKYGIDNVTSQHFIDDCSLVLKGVKIDDSETDILIKDVVILEANLEDGSKEQFIVSKSMIKNTHATTHTKSKTNRFYFYLNDKIEHGILDDTIYLTKSEIPHEIIKGEWKQLLAPYKRKSTLMSKSGLLRMRR